MSAEEKPGGGVTRVKNPVVVRDRLQAASPRSAPSTAWTAFGLAAQKAAVAGFAIRTVGQLIGALIEMQSNIYEHSEAPETGLLPFNAEPGIFEFVAADDGIGMLNSLHGNAVHAPLADHGAALQLALTEGCSRFGDDIGRGMGFRPLFVGLANLQSLFDTVQGTTRLLSMAIIQRW